MRYLKLTLPVFWIFTINLIATPSIFAGEVTIILWEIGQSDDDNSEFWLAPDQFHQYRYPGIHLAGVTDPAKSWPYILPGPLDLWAGPAPQPFEIRFYLRSFQPDADFILTIDFLDTHSYKPPKIQLQVNDQVFEHQTMAGNNDWLMSATDSSGREHVARFIIPSASFKRGENIIRITALEGSFALWDAMKMEAPAGTIMEVPQEHTFIHSVTD